MSISFNILRHNFEEDMLIIDAHKELKEQARTINDEQEAPHDMYVDAISSFDNEMHAVPCDLANQYFAETHYDNR